MKALSPLLFLTTFVSLHAVDRPNILFIPVDDLVPTLGCYGDPLALSPNIDALAAQGTTFLNHHCQWPVCGPSRAVLSTGLMPEETGVTGFRPIRAILPDVITLPQHFRNQGYSTAAAGKFHDFRTVGNIVDPNSSTTDGGAIDDLPSWSIPYSSAGAGYKPPGNLVLDNSAQPLADYADQKVLTQGLAHLSTLAADTKPFFLAVGFKKPHLPFIAPSTYWDMHDPNAFPLATFTSLPIGAATAHADAISNNGELLGYEPFDTTGFPTVAEQRELIHGYYACVSFIDSLVGQVRSTLATTDDLRNPGKKLSETTIIVLWGDHGFHLGDHGKWGKHDALEKSTICPLIIYDPRNPGAGAKTSAPVNTIDLYPTLCELAGLPIPSQPIDATVTSGRPIKGRSLVPVLDDPTSSVNAGAISIYARQGQYGYAYRTPRYRYIEWINGQNVVLDRELYDYQTDPLETRNIAADPANATLLYQLSRSMRAEPATSASTHLQSSAPIAAGPDFYLPFAIDQATTPNDALITWPFAQGVTYSLHSSPNLTAPWTTTSVTSGQTTVPMIDDRHFFRLELDPSNHPPTFTSAIFTIINAEIDTPFIGNISSFASDPDTGDTLTFSKISGPAWLSIASDGSLSGTPTNPDSDCAGYHRILATDNHGATSIGTLQLSVTPPPTNNTTTVDFLITDDTFLKVVDPDATFGGFGKMQLKKSDESFGRIAYLKVPVSGTGNILSATLFLHSDDETDPVQLLAVADTNWTESNLTWNTRPPTGALLGTTTPTAGQWFSYDLTGHITSDGTYAFALDETGNTQGKINSKNNGSTPYIRITWE